MNLKKDGKNSSQAIDIIKKIIEKIKKVLKKYRNIFLMFLDIIVISMAYFVSEILVNRVIPFQAVTNSIILTTIVVSSVVYLAIFSIFKLYRNITRYENGNDYLEYGLACLIAYTIMAVLGILVTHHIVDFRVNMVASLIIVTGVIGYRVVLRLILTESFETNRTNKSKRNVILIGAGSATSIILKSIQSNMRDTYNVIGIIDDNVNKLNHIILGVPILGTRYDIPRICRENKVDGIFFSISNISNQSKRDILNICKETGCKVRVLPGTEDIIKNNSNIIGSFRDVEIEDLLGRDTIKLDNTDIAKAIENKIVLVTGGGGSIGSELCRQIMKFNPEKLVIVDIYENNLYEIEQELRINYPEANNVYAIVASVRDKKRLNEIFEQFRPYLVFHAAAHKHVPLMETSPLEAIKNNVFGTYNTVNCADAYGVHKFILISTDKAVNPTNIMGASKRLCEMIVQAKSKASKTQYAAVRFGNVLGSNGSVIPLFKKQIAKGGPVTVTHREITRFFMTIPEAVSLVLQSMTYANDGEIFVLDMGEPVKIYDMAVNLIKLSGYEPNVDVEIKVTGLRPGEKLYEELLMAEEGLTNTKNDKIFVAPPSEITMNDIKEKIYKLEVLLKENKNEDKETIRTTMKEIVPTFKEPSIVNKEKMEETQKQAGTQKDNVVYLENLG